jgi:hypothetical protein
MRRAAPAVIQALGWFGSILIVTSLALHRPIPFRAVNLASAVVLLVFNFAIGLWSMVALNAAVFAVNAWHLRALRSRAPNRSEQRRVPNLGAAPPAEGWFTPPDGGSARPYDTWQSRVTAVRIDYARTTGHVAVPARGRNGARASLRQGDE